MATHIDSMIQTIRRICTELRPGVLDDLGLVAAIEWQANEFQVRTGTQCRVTTNLKDGLLLQSRPAFGGNIMADILSPNSRPQMATVRPNVMKMAEPVHGRSALVIREAAKIDKSLRRVKVLERKISNDCAAVKIDTARIIVSGGRGMKTKEKFRQLEGLAELLGGVVGASRAAVDLGFKEKSHQVGQSGTTVSPKLYLSFGISGAVQHIVGMKASDVIIAVNKDPNAPIFNVAKYGIVGDAHEIAPKLIEALKKK